MMKEVAIDFSNIESNDDFYRQLGDKMSLPAYFGNNLDALYDVLTGGVELPLTLNISGLDGAKKEKLATLMQTLDDAAENLHGDLIINYMNLNSKEISWPEYLAYFKKIVDKEIAVEPYNEQEFYDYTKLNWSRTNRWLKTNALLDDVKAQIASLDIAQKWIVITEPWCGDAAHIVPILYMMSQANPKIDFKIQFRDDGSEIDKYLTCLLYTSPSPRD